MLSTACIDISNDFLQFKSSSGLKSTAKVSMDIPSLQGLSASSTRKARNVAIVGQSYRLLKIPSNYLVGGKMLRSGSSRNFSSAKIMKKLSSALDEPPMCTLTYKMST